MTNDVTPKKQSLAKRAFLGYGKLFYKTGKGLVKVVKSPATRKVMEGIGRSTEYMVTGKSPAATRTQRQSASTSNETSTLLDRMTEKMCKDHTWLTYDQARRLAVDNLGKQVAEGMQ